MSQMFPIIQIGFTPCVILHSYSIKSIQIKTLLSFSKRSDQAHLAWKVDQGPTSSYTVNVISRLNSFLQCFQGATNITEETCPQMQAAFGQDKEVVFPQGVIFMSFEMKSV